MKQRGNILFLILLAIILFVALSYAVNSGMRGGGISAKKESVQAGAAAIQQYVTLIRNQINRLRLVNGCDASNIDWRHNFYKRYSGAFTDSTGTDPVNPKTGCELFRAKGGAVSPQSFEAYKDSAYEAYYQPLASAQPTAGHAYVRWVNRANEGTPANDIAIIFIGLDPDLCAYLLDPQNPPTGTNRMHDIFDMPTSGNGGSGTQITAVDETIGEGANAQNRNGDFFADFEPYTPGTFCRVGAILLPQ